MIMCRLTEKEGPDGMMQSAIRPYIMDLGSTNGTFLNNERIDSERYYELYEKASHPPAFASKLFHSLCKPMELDRLVLELCSFMLDALSSA